MGNILCEASATADSRDFVASPAYGGLGKSKVWHKVKIDACGKSKSNWTKTGISPRCGKAIYIPKVGVHSGYMEQK
jgi:hypothetical protein